MYFGKFDVDLRIETEREKLRRRSRKAETWAECHRTVENHRFQDTTDRL